jgi:hypothetical protein
LAADISTAAADILPAPIISVAEGFLGMAGQVFTR